MKTYKNLWEDFISEENILASIKQAARGKNDKECVQFAKADIDRYVEHIRSYAENFRSKQHHHKQIKDGKNGKIRDIVIPTFDETVIHHMLINVLAEMFTKGMYRHTYSSIPGRGLHDANRKIVKIIKNDPRHCKYFLKMDIKKFFNSIDVRIIKERLSTYIKDKKILAIFFDILDSEPESGIPLGFYTSHWLANWLLQPLDHYITEQLGAAHYIRYMDDMLITGSNKEDLHQIKDCIEEYLYMNYKLNLKQNWQVSRFEYKSNKKNKNKAAGYKRGEAIDFAGFKFHRNGGVSLRKGLLKRLIRKANKIYKKQKITIHDAYQMVSYNGWASWADTTYIMKHYVLPKCSLNKCKEYISQYSKRRQKKISEAIIYFKEGNYEYPI